MNTQELREKLFGLEEFHLDILEWIQKENLWNIWVPKIYGGKEYNLEEGLELLRHLAFVDGSLGWTITLCSGANYFIGNLDEKSAKTLFSSGIRPILGGSGAVCGIAEKHGDSYKVSGQWKYATGSHYLTHFTLNARIIENGEQHKDGNGEDLVRSFIIPREQVTIIQDWKSMGLQATVTNSFKVEKAVVSEKYSFKYDQFFHSQEIFKIPFQSFADLTLWVNYIGMAQHFLEEAIQITPKLKVSQLQVEIAQADEFIQRFSQKISADLKNGKIISSEFQHEIHASGKSSVKKLSEEIINIFPKLGIKASSTNSQLNAIFRDFFTATQHHNFLK